MMMIILTNYDYELSQSLNLDKKVAAHFFIIEGIQIPLCGLWPAGVDNNMKVGDGSLDNDEMKHEGQGQHRLGSHWRFPEPSSLPLITSHYIKS